MLSAEEIKKLSISLEKAVDHKDRKFCYNVKCNTKSSELVDANHFARIYYGVRKGEKTWKICNKCRLVAENFENQAKHEIKVNGNVFSLEFGKIKSEAEVVDLDADSRGTIAPKSMSISPSAVYSVSEEKVTDEINAILGRLSLKDQTKKWQRTLNNQVDTLEAEFAATENVLIETENRLSELRKFVDKRMISVELGEVDINDKGVVKINESKNLESFRQLHLESEMLAKAKHVLPFRTTGTSSINEVIRETESSNIPDAQPTYVRKVSKVAPMRKQNCENIPPPSKESELKPKRKLFFKLPQPNQMVYAMHADLLHYWIPAKVIAVKTLSSNNSVLTVQLQNNESYRKTLQCSSKNLSSISMSLFGKQIAFTKPLVNVELPVGSRVIAKYNDTLGNNPDINGLYYAGIVAEKCQQSNRERYLIFFDDGYPQYTPREQVLPVVETSQFVWNDVHVDVKHFTREYLLTYPNLLHVKAQVGNRYKIEYDGKWLQARVIEVDGSLMKVKYMGNSPIDTEWIYLGSPRISSLYNPAFIPPGENELADDANAKKPTTISTVTLDEAKSLKDPVSQPETIKRNPLVSTYFETAGSTHKIQIPTNCPVPKEFVSHTCSPSCAFIYNEIKFRKISPLVIPFHLGWAREFRGSKLGSISYITPCGLRLTKYEEIHSYNRITQNNIPVEFFSLESKIDCLNEFCAERQLVCLKDISYGKEWTPVQCINSINHELPDCVEYMSQRKPGKGVDIHFDDDFMVCCDCEDDCKDKSKCACWQLTLTGLSFKKKPSLRGYEYRRLKEYVPSGIYECNSKVVQNKVKWPIQVFRTILKGWGVRALHDIPKGSFLCVYTGELLNDFGATKEGLQNGDEYLADLDYVEVMEAAKDGYESDCTEIIDEDVKGKSLGSSNENSAKTKLQVARKSTACRFEGKGKEKFGADSKKQEPKSVASARGKDKPVPYRLYFGKSERQYSLNGKGLGNFGRYFNHSCDPNLFIQNVFVDTHDLRFPWVAFFTSKDVKAGTELCWDYKYQVGSVPGKVLNCYCTSKNCRGRLL